LIDLFINNQRQILSIKFLLSSNGENNKIFKLMKERDVVMFNGKFKSTSMLWHHISKHNSKIVAETQK
jgi:hypothetical protein